MRRMLNYPMHKIDKRVKSRVCKLRCDPVMRLHADAGCWGGVTVDGYRFPQAPYATN